MFLVKCKSWKDLKETFVERHRWFSRFLHRSIGQLGQFSGRWCFGQLHIYISWCTLCRVLWKCFMQRYQIGLNLTSPTNRPLLHNWWHGEALSKEFLWIFYYCKFLCVFRRAKVKENWSGNGCDNLYGCPLANPICFRLCSWIEWVVFESLFRFHR